MHSTLRPRTNVWVIALAAVVAGTVAALWWTHGTRVLLSVGAAAGLVCGTVQALAIRASAGELVAATDAPGVRRALARSRWGRVYIQLLWATASGLMFLAWAEGGIDGMLPRWLAGYAALVAVRGLVTVGETVRLSRSIAS